MKEYFGKEENFEAVELIDILDKEQKEKSLLHEQIVELTSQLNELRNHNDNLWNENSKMREFYNVPDDFGDNG